MGGTGLTDFPIVAALAPHCIFIPQSEKRASRWCSEGEGGYTVVLFACVLILGAEVDGGRGAGCK